MQYLPNIGLRTLKTALGIFLCLVLFPNEPFFACMTVLFCIQNTLDESIKAALTRSLGTILGGLIGLIFLCLCRYVKTFALPEFMMKLIIYLLIAVGIIITIHCCNLLKHPMWITIACIVFLGVTTANADKAPLFYTLNRIIETLFGMTIGLLINYFVTPPKKNSTS